MHLVSVGFLGLTLAGLVAFHSTRSLAFKRFILMSMDGVFVCSFASDLAGILPTALFLLTGFLSTRAVQRHPSKLRLALGILALLVLFVYLKKYTIVHFLPSVETTYSVVGLSYVLFRVIHVMVDAYGGMIREPVSLGRFFRYTCFFLNWASGPIQRIEAYEQQEVALTGRVLSHEDVYYGFSRATNGFIKLAIVSAILQNLHGQAAAYLQTVDDVTPWVCTYGTACALYTLYMYYNFAGYMDIIIGIGRLLGFTLPENFAKPFAASNFLDFWSRWHITLSEWFKFYVFNPFTKAMTYRWGSPTSTPYLGVVGYFVTFFLMGMWHGSTPTFVFYGLFLGIGVSLNKLYQTLMRRTACKQGYAALTANRFYSALCRGMTFSYFAVALTTFWRDGDTLLQQVGAWGVTTHISVFVLLGCCAGAVLTTVHTLGRLGGMIGERLSVVRDSFWFRQLHLAVRVYIAVVLIAVNATAVPEFVYVAF